MPLFISIPFETRAWSERERPVISLSLSLDTHLPLMNEPDLRALARAGKWAALLETAPPAAASALVDLGLTPSAAATAAASAAAWRVLALIKLGRLKEASDTLARLGDLDALPGDGAPWALRVCKAWLAGSAAAFGPLVTLCEARAAAGNDASAPWVWSQRAQTAALSAARLYAKAGDPASARAWARRALRGRVASGGGEHAALPPSTAPLDSDLPSITGLDAPALDAAARLELALGNVPGARHLFEAAAAVPPSTLPPRPPADAARAAALMRLATGDASRAAAGFGAVGESVDGCAVDYADAAVCLLHAGDLGGAAAGAARPFVGGVAAAVDPAALTPVALRNAAALSDLAPDGRAARAALAAAVAAAGPPDDLDAGVLAGR